MCALFQDPILQQIVNRVGRVDGRWALVCEEYNEILRARGICGSVNARQVQGRAERQG